MFEHSSTNNATCAARNNRCNRSNDNGALLRQRGVGCAFELRRTVRALTL
jgi:hypothetical protein